MFHNRPRHKSRRPSRRGFLAFEWILLISILVIGVIGGLSVVRDSLISELKDLADCVRSLNISPTASNSSSPLVVDPANPNPSGFPSP